MLRKRELQWTSIGAESIQLSDARRASSAGENIRSASSSSSSWYQCILNERKSTSLSEQFRKTLGFNFTFHVVLLAYPSPKRKICFPDQHSLIMSLGEDFSVCESSHRRRARHLAPKQHSRKGKRTVNTREKEKFGKNRNLNCNLWFSFFVIYR